VYFTVTNTAVLVSKPNWWIVH